MGKEFLVIFDLDGTLTNVTSSWQYVLEKIGKWDPYGKKNLNNFLKGKLEGNSIEAKYKEFCRLDAELLKGLQVSEFNKIIDMIAFRPNIKTLIDFLVNKINCKTIIISAGFQELAERAKKLYNIDSYFANSLGKSDDLLDGSVKINVSWSGKKTIVKKLKYNFQIPHEKVISFGDSTLDIDLFNESGLSFSCFDIINEKVLSSSTHHIIDFSQVPNLIMKYLDKIKESE